MYDALMYVAALIIPATIVGLIRPSWVRLGTRMGVIVSGVGAFFAVIILATALESDEDKAAREQERAAQKARQDSVAAVQARAAAERWDSLPEHEREAVWAAQVLPKVDRWAAHQMAVKFVRQAMPTPDSVEFPSFNGYDEAQADVVRAYDDVFEHKGTLYRQYSVHSTFQADNRFGAKIRYEVNVWVYHNASDPDNWSRHKINIIDPSLRFGDPNRTVVDYDPPEAAKPRRAPLPEGWVPNVQ